MNHFVPKFSSTDIESPNYSELSSDDRLSIGLTQNVIATFKSSDEIIKSSERQFKNVLSTMNHNAMLSRVISENQLDEAIESNHNLRLLNGNIGNLDLKLSSLLDIHTITNNKLDELIKVTGIPEFEKERLFYFSEAVKFLKESKKSDRRFKDALENLNKSYSLNSTDYVTSYMLSSIYLYNESFMDFKKAEEMLLKSIDYSSSADDKFTANSYKHLAYCQLLQYKLEDAIDSCKEGYKLDDSIIDLYVIEIECEILMNNKPNIIKLIKNLCKKDINNVTILKSNKTILESDTANIAINSVIDKFNKEYDKSLNRLRYLDSFIEFDYNYSEAPTLIGYANTKSALFLYFNESDFSEKIVKITVLNKLIEDIEGYLKEYHYNIDDALYNYRFIINNRNKKHGEKPISNSKLPIFHIVCYIVMAIVVIGCQIYLFNK